MCNILEVTFTEPLFQKASAFPPSLPPYYPQEDGWHGWPAGCLTRWPTVSLGSLCSCRFPSLTLYLHHTYFHYLLCFTRTVHSELRAIEARMEHSHPLAVKGQVRDLWVRSLSSQPHAESWIRYWTTIWLPSEPGFLGAQSLPH